MDSRSPVRLVAGLLAALSLTTCLPSEPSGDRVGFELVFQQPLKLPIGAVVTPLVRIIADGHELQNPRYRFESLGPGVVRVVDVESLDDTLGQDPVVRKGQLLQGLARGAAPVRVVYETATGVADTTFAVQVVVSRVSILGGPPADTMALPALRRLGDTLRLTAAAFDYYGGWVSGLLPFTWTSSDPTVATIAAGAGGASGLITARNEGTTLITAKLDDVEGSVQIRVTQAAARVIVTPEVDTLRTLSRSRLYSFRALDSTNAAMEGAKARWSSSNPGVARVDADGVATAEHAGTTLIIAQVGPAADTATLVVKQVVRYLQVASPRDTLTAIGDTIRVVASASDSLGYPIPDLPPISWATGDTTIATVDPTGVVTARRNGFVLIIASSAGKSGTITILVRQVVVRVQIAEDSVALVGDAATVRLTAVGEDRNGNTVDTARVDWLSRLPFVATVDTMGLVTARGDGTTRIMATVRNGQQSDTATVSVTGAPQQLIAFESSQGIEAIRPDGTQRTVLLWNYTGNCSYYYYYGSDEYATDAAWSPDGNRLAYTRTLYDCYYGTSELEVYRAPVDGSLPENLTNHFATDFRPAWSPDGGRIAFTSNRDVDGLYHIWVMSADGTNAVRAGTDPAADFEPAWSPDGGRIAFVSDRDGVSATDNEVYVMNADGSGVSRLTTAAGQDVSPAWSPDGNQLAFVSDRAGTADVWLMNPDGSGARNLTGSLFATGDEVYPTWSPDGSQIAFSMASDLYVMNPDGTGLRLLTTGGWRPAWRPATPLVIPAGAAAVARPPPHPRR